MTEHKHITFVFKGGDAGLAVQGEPMHDITQNLVMVCGEGGAYVTLNWDDIRYMSVAPCDGELE
jgi:hypothetical protein